MLQYNQPGIPENRPPQKIVASNKEWIYSFVKTQVIFDGISSAAKTQVDSDQVREGLILPLLLLFWSRFFFKKAKEVYVALLLFLGVNQM